MITLQKLTDRLDLGELEFLRDQFLIAAERQWMSGKYIDDSYESAFEIQDVIEVRYYDRIC